MKGLEITLSTEEYLGQGIGKEIDDTYKIAIIDGEDPKEETNKLIDYCMTKFKADYAISVNIVDDNYRTVDFLRIFDKWGQVKLMKANSGEWFEVIREFEHSGRHWRKAIKDFIKSNVNEIIQEGEMTK